MNKEILIWKVLKLGRGPKNGQEFISTLESKDFFLSEWAKDLLSQPDFTVTNEEMEIKLVKSSLLQLGLKSGGRLTDICEMAGGEYGFQLCPPEVGPGLREQYPDQLLFSPNLHVAMMPLMHKSGQPLLWQLSRFGAKKCLYTNSGCPRAFYRPDSNFVFIQP